MQMTFQQVTRFQNVTFCPSLVGFFLLLPRIIAILQLLKQSIHRASEGVSCTPQHPNFSLLSSEPNW